MNGEPIPNVFLSENHDQAFYVWQQAGVRQRVLVHIDAHHDMWWIDDRSAVTIADFICPALKLDLVGEVFWVVPDQTFANQENRTHLLRHIERILKAYPGASQAPVVAGQCVIASVLGKKFTVCTLASLPPPQEPVLLDIDVDYLILPKVTYGEPERPELLPWLRPAELLQRLGKLPVHLATIAYSVEGGFTPLRWKYLGDELALRLRNPEGTPELEGMAMMHAAAAANAAGDTQLSESKYRASIELLPTSAAPLFNLARLLAKLGRTDEARQLYQRAVALDASYQGAYACDGFPHLLRKELDAAAAEFHDLQLLHPSDAYAHLGLGLVAEQRQRWSEAELHLRSAVVSDDRLLDAYLALGRVLVKMGRKLDAVTAFETALKLGLMGLKPLSGCILTRAPENRLVDPTHCDTYIRLSALYAQTGSPAKAVNALRIGIAGGENSVSIRLRLARLYARQGKWRQSLGEAGQALRISPRDFRNALQRLGRKSI